MKIIYYFIRQKCWIK